MSKRQTKTKKNVEKPYEVILFYTQTCRAVKIVMAKNLAEAQQKADDISAEDLGDHELDPVDGELDVDSVALAEEGKSHD